jgi:hypothetical protein
MNRRRTFADIERQALREANPPNARKAEWKKQFASSVKLLKQEAKRPPTSPRERRDKLRKLIAALDRHLPKLFPEGADLRSVGQAFRDAAAALEADQKSRVSRRGGPDASDPHVHLKPLAAQFAFHLLVDYGRGAPKLHQRQCVMASLLLEAATGATNVTVVAACKQYRDLRRIILSLTNLDISPPVLGAPQLNIRKKAGRT